MRGSILRTASDDELRNSFNDELSLWYGVSEEAVCHERRRRGIPSPKPLKRFEVPPEAVGVDQPSLRILAVTYCQEGGATMPCPPKSGLVGAAQVAQRLGVSTHAVYRWARLGEIPFYRLGQNFVRFDLEEVVAARSEHGKIE